MEKLTSLNLTFDRVIIQLVIPGLIAALPYLLILTGQKLEHLPSLIENLNTHSTLLILFASLIIGIFLENIGSLIEVYYYDPKHRKKQSDYDLNWKKYLQLCFQNEPIGQRYLRNILFRMKFELSVGIAFIIMAIGVFCLQYINSFSSNTTLTITLLCVIPTGASLYLILFEGLNSSIILANVRQLLIEKYYENQSNK